MYSRIVSALQKASVPVRELHGTGAVAITLAAGRIVALAFAQDEPNLLWSNPKLDPDAGTELGQAPPPGGIGGDRLWFSPELRYHWASEPDWRGLSNYTVPADTDPGHYEFVDAGPGEVALRSRGRLPVLGSGESMAFCVERRVRMTQPPIPFDDPRMRGVRYVGVETHHELTIEGETRRGEIDLWHVLQIPVGSTLIVPLLAGHAAEPLSYGLPGAWKTTSNSMIWRFEGHANAKIGIAARALTGRSAFVRRIASDQWCLVVRHFPVDVSARYGDYPQGSVRDDQVFQAWDGMGFGEMEYHSPVLDAERGPRSLREQDQIWAFGGDDAAIGDLADHLLGVDIREWLS